MQTENTITIDQLTAEGLRIDQLHIRPHEAWCLIGGNTSGIQELCGLFSGENRDYRAVRFDWPANLGLVSFQQQQALFEEELRKDNTDFLDRIDPGTTVRTFLGDPDRHGSLVALFKLDAVLDQGIRQLSSGQTRKLCLLKEIIGGRSFLILENPREGLDASSREELDRVLSGLHDRGVGIVHLVNNLDDIPDWCTHIGAFCDGALTVQGKAETVRNQVRDLIQGQKPLFRVAIEEVRQERCSPVAGAGDELIRLQNGFADYGEVRVFRNLNLTVNRGDHTLITGPNGCGKSTLLQIITGDHPLCYRNDLCLFGQKRGSGESIWDIKKRMGIVSADLHRNHRVSGSALAIVLSGLFDSIGLYSRPTQAQEQLARRWLARLGLVQRAAHPFRQLSFGEQRLILVARALIKVPELLILDEATQGLDEHNRLALLDFLEQVGQENLATILYVSHRSDEHRPFFRQHVNFTREQAETRPSPPAARIQEKP
ncbi:MAG: ATP-binding cassette domain-containing protein [Desulfobulbus sp.]